MSLDKNKEKCVCCKAYLFEEDDVVYCPVCGAPHHRDCYNAEGRCALENAHGTEEQYDKLRKASEKKDGANEKGTEPENIKTAVISCPTCGNMYSVSSKSCPSCGAGRPPVMFTVDALGGMPPDMDVGDGVTAKEAGTFVLANSNRYVPKFAAFKYGKHSSWNWIAFLFPSVWFLSRKMYKIGALMCSIFVALSMLSVPFLSEFEQFTVSSAGNSYQAMLQAFSDNIGSFSKAALAVFFAATVGKLILSVICGIFGDSLYRNYVIASVKKIKAESEDLALDMRRKGGVSIVAMALGFLITQYLPTIILNFAG